MRLNLRWFASLCLIVGCARGAAGLPEADAATGTGSPLADDDDGGSSNASTGGDSSNTGDGSDGSTTGGGGTTGGDGSSAGDPDGSTGAQSDAGTTGAANCDAPLSCEAATAAGVPNLGSIEWSNTDLAYTKSASGSRWYMVTVGAGMAGEFVKGGVEAKLSSPVGSNYDLFMYGGAEKNDSALELCEVPSSSSEAVAAQSTAAAGMPDDAYIVWAGGIGGFYGAHVVTVEVRHIDGPCADFTLEIYGAKK